VRFANVDDDGGPLTRHKRDTADSRAAWFPRRCTPWEPAAGRDDRNVAPHDQPLRSSGGTFPLPPIFPRTTSIQEPNCRRSFGCATADRLDQHRYAARDPQGSHWQTSLGSATRCRAGSPTAFLRPLGARRPGDCRNGRRISPGR
jgi:hypothetical protein